MKDKPQKGWRTSLLDTSFFVFKCYSEATGNTTRDLIEIDQVPKHGRGWGDGAAAEEGLTRTCVALTPLHCFRLLFFVLFVFLTDHSNLTPEASSSNAK